MSVRGVVGHDVDDQADPGLVERRRHRVDHVARRLLAEAGFPGGRGLPPLELLFNTSENHRAVAEALQQKFPPTKGKP